MKITLKALRSRSIDRLVIESVDLSLYIAFAETGGERLRIVEPDGRSLKTRNLIAMKSALAKLSAPLTILEQRSAYDEMVGQNFPDSDNLLELPLGPGYETLPPWQH